MKKVKKLSELQKANLLTGQLLRRCSCTSELIRFLKEEGYSDLASQVNSAMTLGRELAYKRGRAAIAKAKAATQENANV